MRFIQPVVDAQTARLRLERQRFRRFRGWLRAVVRRGRPAEPSASNPTHLPEFRRPLPHMDVVWLPYYRITIESVAKGESREIDTLVGGHDGLFAIMDLAGLTLEPQPQTEHFGPTVDEAQAVEIAQTGLVAAILRSPGWTAKPTVGATRRVELVQYPFWVYYFERRRGRLDIKVLDAVTGNLPGPKVKGSILEAFVASRRVVSS